MENKIKAALATLLSLLLVASVVYGILRSVQFIGFLIGAFRIGAIAVGIYKSFHEYFEDKSNNKQ